MSVIIPASDEERLIGRCLEALLASDPKPGAGSGSIPLPLPVEVIVVANGCSDRTADVARGFARRFSAMGWDFQVLEQAQGGKMAALNAGDAAARHPARAYLDADVVVSRPLLDQLGRALQGRGPVYASGRVSIAEPTNSISKAYARTYERVPFMVNGVPGCGLFAVNGAGRKRWRQFPDIISDDTFVRLLFSPKERIGVGATYDWPIVEGFANLVRVRSRQNAGVREVFAKYPELRANDDKTRLGPLGIARLALRDPVGFAVYAAVALRVKLMPASGEWSRGR